MRANVDLKEIVPGTNISREQVDAQLKRMDAKKLKNLALELTHTDLLDSFHQHASLVPGHLIISLNIQKEAAPNGKPSKESGTQTKSTQPKPATPNASKMNLASV